MIPGDSPVNDQLVEFAGAIWVIRFAENELLVDASTRYSVAPTDADPQDRFTCVEEMSVADRLLSAAGASESRSALAASRKPISLALNKSDCESEIWKSPY